MNYVENLNFHQLKCKYMYHYDNNTYKISIDIFNIICKYHELIKYSEDKIFRKNKNNLKIKEVIKNTDKAFRRLNKFYCKNKNIIDNVTIIVTILNISYL